MSKRYCKAHGHLLSRDLLYERLNTRWVSRTMVISSRVAMTRMRPVEAGTATSHPAGTPHWRRSCAGPGSPSTRDPHPEQAASRQIERLVELTGVQAILPKRVHEDA